ncbi:serpin B6-like [Scyliorhinus canicula]|uniref:serpin B6-like n=1 Tax=Scyliorhinus canicula TaxID=7830 RepID=UPI0018F540A6|nr:serpin B6-like [Scyliorhinus canicula]
MNAQTKASGRFALDLYLHLCENNRTENIFFAPLSISIALGMVHLGAKGNTSRQMAKVLHFDAEGHTHSELQRLQSKMIHLSSGCLLKLANGLFMEKSFNFHPGYLESVSKFYQAKVTAVDFAGGSEEARIHINLWLEGQTEGKIQNLLAQDTIDQESKLVLVNAIYFKGNWEKKFDEGDTEERLFRVTKDESKPVKMMCQKGMFNTAYIVEVAANILELPYAQNELSMIILLPDEISGLEKLQKKLTYEKLSKWTSTDNLHLSEVLVYLPKFTLEGSYDLRPTLSTMGMSEAFDAKSADFSGMAESDVLTLSKVIHKSFVEVHEEGSEAAASTEVTMSFRSLNFTDEFIADHPFLFFIRHNKTRSILFFGRFSTP